MGFLDPGPRGLNNVISLFVGRALDRSSLILGVGDNLLRLFVRSFQLDPSRGNLFVNIIELLAELREI